jgi:hypothetical protein
MVYWVWLRIWWGKGEMGGGRFMGILIRAIYYKFEDGIMYVCKGVIHLQLLFTQVMYLYIYIL